MNDHVSTSIYKLTIHLNTALLLISELWSDSRMHIWNEVQPKKCGFVQIWKYMLDTFCRKSIISQQLDKTKTYPVRTFVNFI